MKVRRLFILYGNIFMKLIFINSKVIVLPCPFWISFVWPLMYLPPNHLNRPLNQHRYQHFYVTAFSSIWDL